MAGIRLSDKASWILARWAYDYLVERISRRLPAGTRAMERLQASQQDGTNYASLQDLPATERKLFYDAVCRVQLDMQTTGESVFKAPEFFPGFMQHLQRLVTIMREEWTDMA